MSVDVDAARVNPYGMSRLVVIVHGEPAPQGSKRVLQGHAVESSAKVKPWRQAVVAATLDALAEPPPPGCDPWAPGKDRPLALTVTFTMARPRSHYRADGMSLGSRAPLAPFTRPDLDKLVRSTLDGLADAGAYFDDSRVVNLLASKCYPGEDLDALDVPGALLLLRPWGLGR